MNKCLDCGSTCGLIAFLKFLALFFLCEDCYKKRGGQFSAVCDLRVRNQP